MPLDRQLQLQILKICAEHYPHMTAEVEALAPMPVLAANLVYLEDHGLVDAALKMSTARQYVFAGVKATHKGMDFLADDGGLSAILGLVVIKIHDDTIKDLLAAKIQAADLPPADKKRFLDQLRELPAETTKHLVLRLVDMGLDSAPQAMAWLGKWLSGQ